MSTVKQLDIDSETQNFTITWDSSFIIYISSMSATIIAEEKAESIPLDLVLKKTQSCTKQAQKQWEL